MTEDAAERVMKALAKLDRVFAPDQIPSRPPRPSNPSKPNQGMEQKNSAKPISGSQIPRPQKMTEAGAEAIMKALARIKMS